MGINPTEIPEIGHRERIEILELAGFRHAQPIEESGIQETYLGARIYPHVMVFERENGEIGSVWGCLGRGRWADAVLAYSDERLEKLESEVK